MTTSNNLHKKVIIPDQLKHLFIVATLIFLLILIAMYYEVWRHVFLPFGNYSDYRIHLHILSRAFLTAIIATSIYQLSKSILSAILKTIFAKIPEPINKSHATRINYALDIFIITAGILCTIPLRPVLQEAYVSTQVLDLAEHFVRYDSLPTVIILSYFGALTIIFILLWQRTIDGGIKIIVVVCTIALAGMLNNTPNYDAQISEARAAWAQGRYEDLITEANEALAVAKTNREKAVAYYWIGVGYNRLDQPKQTIEYQKKAISADPQYGIPYSSLALAYISLKDYKNGSESAQRCIEKSPNYAWCYLAMFDYYFFKEIDMKKAEYYLQKAEESDPHNREIKEKRVAFEKDKQWVLEVQAKGGIVEWKE